MPRMKHASSLPIEDTDSLLATKQGLRRKSSSPDIDLTRKSTWNQSRYKTPRNHYKFASGNVTTPLPSGRVIEPG